MVPRSLSVYLHVQFTCIKSWPNICLKCEGTEVAWCEDAKGVWQEGRVWAYSSKTVSNNMMYIFLELCLWNCSVFNKLFLFSTVQYISISFILKYLKTPFFIFYMNCLSSVSFFLSARLLFFSLRANDQFGQICHCNFLVQQLHPSRRQLN